MTNNNEMRRRLEALQKKLNASEHGRRDACMCVLQTGGLPPGELLFGAAGMLTWTRGISAQGEIIEEEESFVLRCKEGARAAGERNIHISSFPGADEEQRRVAKLAMDFYFDNDSGIPPVEARAPAMSTLQRKLLG